MPSGLAKVTKRVSKKKGGTKIGQLHENSRDSKRLRRASNRDERVARLSKVRQNANRQWLDRVFFFQDNLPDAPLDVEGIQTLIEEYLERDSEEMEQLKADRRPGRPASTRFTLLEQQQKLEEKEYDAGFWIPNLQDEGTLAKLEGWNGEWVGLGPLRFIRVAKDGDVKGSQFPPRGAS